jgi:DNA primase
VTTDRVRVGRRTVELRRTDKVLFPGDGLTKGDLIGYYKTIGAGMVPYLRGRPLTLERFRTVSTTDRCSSRTYRGTFRPLVKTTGGKGLHVHVQLDRTADFGQVRAFARGVAQVLVARDPERYTIEQRTKNRQGRLYLDVMRNGYGQTAVPPFAVRARPGAPVATPLDWSELDDRRIRGDRFTVRTVPRRLGDC